MVHDIAVVILAGGRSSRIGGFKPLLKLAGRPLISYALEIARFTVSSPYILVSNQEQAIILKQLDCTENAKFLTDPEGSIGPYSVVKSSSKINEGLIFLMGCDTPFLDPRLPLILLHHIDNSPAVVPIWPNGYLEPLAALYRKKPLSEINFITSFREIVAKIGAKTVGIEVLGVQSKSFFNINTWSDLKKAELMLKNHDLTIHEKAEYSKT
ncbi:MAG: molybdenum cofactor guanylyltransferase [Candidatus Methanomethylicaceae archaeon]|nr:molybdenum cofactor guanylyltransferase [Candidatus Verstraetearchaeota archaeon]